METFIIWWMNDMAKKTKVMCMVKSESPANVGAGQGAGEQQPLYCPDKPESLRGPGAASV